MLKNCPNVNTQTLQKHAFFLYLVENKILSMKDNKNNLYTIRKQKGLSQKDIAEMLGVSYQQISFLENGDRQLTDAWLERLSKALNCTKAEILGEAPVLTQREAAFLDMLRQLPAEGQLDIMTELHHKIEQLKTNKANIEKKIV